MYRMSDINVQTFSGKVNIGNNLKVGAGHLFVDTQNNRVGLVTDTPDAGLHVNSNAYVHTDLRVGSGIVMNDKVATFGTTKTSVTFRVCLHQISMKMGTSPVLSGTQRKRHKRHKRYKRPSSHAFQFLH